MKQFDVPIIYRSPLISAIKKKRKEEDKIKKPAPPGSQGTGRDYSPTLLDFGPVQIFLARHFGFCYGVENAIDIAFKTIQENPHKRIFLLSEMIHNPQVNADLQTHGVRFLQDTYGNELIPFDELNADDIVLIPAFGTTVEMEKRLYEIGIQIEKYNTTCPFVEKVWNRSKDIAAQQYTVIIHGKPNHEETRATFSHSSAGAPTVIVKDMQQTIELAKYITGEKPSSSFYDEFKGQHSEEFDVQKDLQKIGVVNQTTMLASETQAIADYLKNIMVTKYQSTEKNIQDQFADTRDTLCYATNDNQTAVIKMLEIPADLAIVVGGYNSSNTSHLVELCEKKFPTYFIGSDENLLSSKQILHYDLHTKKELQTTEYLPQKPIVKILLTSGASCPDALVEGVIDRLLQFYPTSKKIDDRFTDDR